MSTMTLWAMVDKSGHVCRDEDGKVVYEREDHHSLDVRRFDRSRPQSKPHRVVRFDAHLASREADAVPFDIEAAASAFIEEGCEGESGTSYPSKPAAWFITQFANSLPALYASPVAQEAAAPVEAIVLAWIPDGLIQLLDEVSSMLSEEPDKAESLNGYRYAMADELRGFSLMLAAAPEVPA